MAITEIVTLLKDVLLGGAAITGAFIANKGLTTWKRQLSGNSEYELSRRILVTLYKYRDAINGVRNPFIWNYEMPTPPEDQLKKMTPRQVSFFGTQKAYEARWESVQIERRNLYVHLLEAEAIWGEQLKPHLKTLFKLQNELLIRIQNHIELINPDTDEGIKEATKYIKNNRRDILFDNSSEEGDEYKKDFQMVVEEIEKYLKPKLHY